MRESDEPLTDTLVRCLADSMDLKALERLENDGDQAGVYCFNVCWAGSAVFFRSVG